MADEQRILDIIDGLEENFTEQEAYRIYIEFCFRFIPRIEHKIPEKLRAHLEVAEGYWHAGNVSPQALENARVLIWKYLDSHNLTYAPLRKSAAIRFTSSSGIKQIRIFGITLTGAGSCCLIWGIRTIRSCKSWSMCSPRPHEKVSPHSHTLISSRNSGRVPPARAAPQTQHYFADSTHGVTLTTNTESTYFILI